MTALSTSTPGRLAASVALLLATAAWGSTFVVTKSVLDDLDPAVFLAWRFGVAAVVLLALTWRRTLAMSREDRGRAAVLGLLLGAGFLLQTTGLQHTTASLSGFLTGSSVVLVPIVAAAVFRQSVPPAGWVGVGVSFVGLVLLTAQPGPADGLLAPGAAVTLVGAACFAGHITALGTWATPANAAPLTALSVAVTAGVCWVVGVQSRGPLMPRSSREWLPVLYVALVATCLGLLVQAWAQSAIPAVSAAVIMTMEPVFAAVLAVALAGEALDGMAWVGGALVVLAMGVAELGARDCCDVASPRVECC